MSGLKIAIPNKGRMSDDIFELLQRAGFSLSKAGDRTLSVKTDDGKYEIIFVRTKDIPKFTCNGTCDVGFTGLDVVHEADVEVDNILNLDFGHCKMIVAAKEEEFYSKIDELPDGLKVATSFPTVAKKYFNKIGKIVEITEVSGATEIMPGLGLVDIIVDITSTGSTLKANKLRIIDEILTSNAVIIGRPGIKEDRKLEIEAFTRAIKSAIDAKEKKYLMAHVQKAKLDEIKTILPGLSSPTVTSLIGNDHEVVIHVVINKSEVYESIDKLKQLGSSGILIMTVDQMIP
jgi:ATP phosphoribosyltransferase